MAKIHAMPGVTYQHKKTRGLYAVESIGVIEKTGEAAVIYRRIDPAVSDNRLWIRPYEEFCDGRFIFAGDITFTSSGGELSDGQND